MPKGKHKPLTLQDYKYIEENYLKLPIKRIAGVLGISFARVMRHLDKKGLKIPKEVRQKRLKSTCFKKGHKTFNKGLKQQDYMSAQAIQNTKASQFKKGQTPHNTKYNGAIVQRKDTSTGRWYKYIRISKGNWELYQRYVWEKVNGNIPKDHLVVFKDGNSLNTQISNLELITKAENMLRNSKHDFPEEIIPSMVLVNQLERKLKDIEDGKK